ncbi:uncharacterized protein TRAVEDRAFT_73812 [Trametes versicolor FP-101664 SS1]|uniref:uncharacterized protein n=1 Tax=Trametes versicolor (strain FP-101664) TaxID=717944 RepID=UPI000462312B|nr:uncharacterized protein TRAVEDRAFT_73812 [Trametes versicolor FP-101664 SS1]EIW56241.1 hypothetical protein TRAVEDRAFT_73812 [Trametes versicolor FP-101664 SS1]
MPPQTSSTAGWTPLPEGRSTEINRKNFKDELVHNVKYSDRKLFTKKFLPGKVTTLTSNEATVTRIVDDVKEECHAQIVLIEELSCAKSGSEVKFYPPMAAIFASIEKACAKVSPQTRKYYRSFVSKDKELLRWEDPLIPNILEARGKPDFALAEVSPPEGVLTTHLDPKSVLWRHCSAFIEVKGSASDLPITRDEKAIKDTLAQGADYARILFHARPFQLYVYGIFFCGDSWCLGYFDRRGAIIAAPVALYKDHQLVDAAFRDFVKMIIRFTWEITPEELGHDPSMVLLQGYGHYSKTPPRFLVAINDSVEVRTFGLPMWSSQSMLGRGTAIWKAVDVSSGLPVILKYAWRSQGRLAESAIYEKIASVFEAAGEAIPKGMASFKSGGDAQLEGGTLTVRALRKLPEFTKGIQPDAVLHRVVLNDFGKSLWEYSSGEELMDAMYTAVSAHLNLYKRKFLHRDISAGNILIRVHTVYQAAIPEKELDERFDTQDLPITEGFLTDFELASYPVPDPAAKEAGETMTGTVAFMATELLQAVVAGKTITRTAAHDLESFCWVFIYTLYLRALRDMPKGQKRSDLQSEYRKIFAAIGCVELLDKRWVALPSDQDQFLGNIDCLRAHLDDLEEKTLRICLNTCWYYLKCFQPNRRMRTLPEMAEGAGDRVPAPFGSSTKATHEMVLLVFSTPERMRKRKRGDSGSEMGREHVA